MLPEKNQSTDEQGELSLNTLMVIMGTAQRWHYQWRSSCPPQILKKILECAGIIFIYLLPEKIIYLIEHF